MKNVTVVPFFVELIPEKLEEHKIYISKKHNVAVHLCLCGCGKETVTPLDGDGWRLVEIGAEISLTPSIGNFQFLCQSHYVITNNIANFE